MQGRAVRLLVRTKLGKKQIERPGGGVTQRRWQDGRSADNCAAYRYAKRAVKDPLSRIDQAVTNNQHKLETNHGDRFICQLPLARAVDQFRQVKSKFGRLLETNSDILD